MLWHDFKMQTRIQLAALRDDVEALRKEINQLKCSHSAYRIERESSIQALTGYLCTGTGVPDQWIKVCTSCGKVLASYKSKEEAKEAKKQYYRSKLEELDV